MVTKKIAIKLLAVDSYVRFAASIVMAVLLSALASGVRADDGWQSRTPLQDTFVHSDQRTSSFGLDGSLIVGSGRETCLMFDVSGLENVTAAKIRLYVSQCGTTEGVVWPLYVRVMRNTRWYADELTWNSLPDEFRVAPSPVLATDDPSLAGYVEIPAGSLNTWQEIDVTAAVKAAAPSGRLALHVYTSWDGNSGDTTPLVFKSSECSEETLRPELAFQGPVDAVAVTRTIFPSGDTYIQGNTLDTAYGEKQTLIVDRDGREVFIKFDLSDVGAEVVDSAVFQLYVPYFEGQTGHDYTSDESIQFELTEKADWNEEALTWKNAPSQTGTAVGRGTNGWTAEVPSNAVRAPSAEMGQYYTVDLTKLVNQVLAAGGKTCSLHIWRNPSDSSRFFFINSMDCDIPSHYPRLLVTPKASEAFISPKIDAPLTTRRAVQETFVGEYGPDTAYFGSWMQINNAIQIGFKVDNDVNKVEYGLLLFDPSGLEHADFVRMRLKARNWLSAGNGIVRVAAWTTDKWSATNMTWNALSPWFPQPDAITADAMIDGEVANINLTQNKYAPYVEVDVTSAVRAAARDGRMVTFGLFSSSNWPEFQAVTSEDSPILIFPPPQVPFGKTVTCSLDRSGATPALRLEWSPSMKEGAIYMVERLVNGSWTVVATGLTEATCIDGNAKPRVEHTYRITEMTSGESTTKSVTLDATVTVFASADTYVQNGSGPANSSFGTEGSIVHKYEWGEHYGGIREGFYRFSLSDVPENFKSATLMLYPNGDGAQVSDNVHIELFKYPDFAWDDAGAPKWNDVFGNGWGTPQAINNHPDPKRQSETEIAILFFSRANNITQHVPVCFDVAGAIRESRSKGDTHITLHTATYNGNNQWNFSFISREHAYGPTLAPQIVFSLENWVKRGLSIVVR